MYVFGTLNGVVVSTLICDTREEAFEAVERMQLGSEYTYTVVEG